MRSFLSIAIICQAVCTSLLIHQIDAQSTTDAARCAYVFGTITPTTCESLSAFALCTTTIAIDDEFKEDASRLVSLTLAITLARFTDTQERAPRYVKLQLV